VILAGLLLKTGVYGLIRFGFTLFPGVAAAALPWLSVVALIGLYYGAWVAFAQRDAKRLVAYSSVSHMGLLVVGLCAGNTLGFEGGVLQMVNHGVTTGALFAMVGMIDQRAHTRQLDELGGLWSKAPVLSGFFLFFALASMGLPGLNNFSGEILVLLGAFQSNPWTGAVAAGGMVLAAAYLLRLVQGVLWGAPSLGASRSAEPWPDLTWREAAVVIPLAVLVLWLGLHPATFQDAFRETVGGMLSGLGLAGGTP
jgi:NADH-quinone oxidoreductase subunit M